jgi:hypothetical protein
MAIDLDTRANQFCTNGLQMYVKHHYKSSVFELSFAFPTGSKY